MRNYFSLLLTLFLSHSCFAQREVLIVTHANVIDMRNGSILKNTSVQITGNRITAIAPDITAPAKATIIDATGKYLMPGLWDMHAHLRDAPRPVLTELLVNGVTGFRETGNGFEEHIGKWKDSINSSDEPWARIVAEAGAIIDGPGDNRGNRFAEVNTVNEAKEAVDQHKKDGADFIKVYDRVAPASYFAIVSEAKKLHMPLDGHLPLSLSLKALVNAGQQCFEHINNFHFRCTPNEDSIVHAFSDSITTYGGNLFVQLQNYGYSRYDPAKTHEIASLFKEHNCFICPTIILSCVDVISVQNDSIQKSFFKDVPENILKAFKVDFSDTLIYAKDPMLNKLFERELEMLAIFHQAGVHIIAGTDASPIHTGVIPGFSLHDELALYVKAGFTNLEALQTATIEAAIFLKKEKDFGTIEKGKIADLVLLDANPLQDIYNLRKIQAVIRNGKYLDRRTLDKIQSEIVSLR